MKKISSMLFAVAFLISLAKISFAQTATPGERQMINNSAVGPVTFGDIPQAGMIMHDPEMMQNEMLLHEMMQNALNLQRRIMNLMPQSAHGRMDSATLQNVTLLMMLQNQVLTEITMLQKEMPPHPWMMRPDAFPFPPRASFPSMNGGGNQVPMTTTP